MSDQVLPSEIARALGLRQRKEAKTCAKCGREFVGVLRARYCGELCLNAAWRSRNRETLNRKRREKYARQKGEKAEGAGSPQ